MVDLAVLRQGGLSAARVRPRLGQQRAGGVELAPVHGADAAGAVLDDPAGGGERLLAGGVTGVEAGPNPREDVLQRGPDARPVALRGRGH